MAGKKDESERLCVMSQVGGREGGSDEVGVAGGQGVSWGEECGFYQIE